MIKKAIVIGATSGIGRGISQVLVKQNYLVGITGRRSNLLEALKSENPSQYITSTFDISETKSINQKLEELTKQLGGLDLLIVSAGTGKILEKLEFENEKNTIDVNVLGFTAICDWAYNYFESQKYGHLVGISSIAGLRGARYAPAYNATKSFQMKYLEGLRQKAKNKKLDITITDIQPGFVDTAMAQGNGVFWVASVEKAAKQIVNAINKKKRIAYITKRWRFLAILFKIVPNWFYERF